MNTIWQKLARHYEATRNRAILDLFDTRRAQEFSVQASDMLLDYSKINIDTTARGMLLALAEKSAVAAKRDAMFAGKKINQTEDRAVLHTALRNLDASRVLVDGQDVMPAIRATLDSMRNFADGVRTGDIHAASGRIFSDVVNIGIGGSDLGPAMACLALTPYHDGPRCHFVSNVDGANIHDVLANLRPQTTLIVVASKTFTTVETMTNAATARRWLAAGIGAPNTGAHLVALSSATAKTADWGISPDRVFGFEDWVGGRYSLWGPIGLSLMLAIGPENFDDFLRGGQVMDRHFCSAPLAKNMPVMLALTGIWHNQICGYATRAILPYDQRLSRLPAYFQQLEMESNGKSVAMDGTDLARHSGPIIWGEPGTNGQHAFYQLIHQGSRIVPCEFMVAARGHEPDLANQHNLLIANCLAQSEALMCGRSLTQTRASLRAMGLSDSELNRQARHRVFMGNRPSTTLIYPRLTPTILGQIIALYEHRVFVEGTILGLNSYDQWGVELGKELAVAMEPVVSGGRDASDKDPSTQMLVNYLRSHT